MARPTKTGLDYFPFDTGFFEDEKIACLAGEFGLKGELVAIKLLCAVYRNGYFLEWSEATKLKFLRSVPGVSVGLLDQIISSLLRWGFFCRSLVESANVLTSVGIQRRYFEATKFRKQEKDLPYLLIDLPKNYSQNRVSQGLTPVSQKETPVSHWESTQKEKKYKRFTTVNPKEPSSTVGEDKARFEKFRDYYLAPERQEFRDVHSKNHGISDFAAAFDEFYELLVERDILSQIRTQSDFTCKFRALYCIPISQKRYERPQGTIADRKKRFKNQIYEIMTKAKDANGNQLYDPDMCSNFFRYWTELSTDETLMRFEEQKFWETEKRMRTWKQKM